MHRAIDRIALDGITPLICVGFDETGQSVSIVYGPKANLVPLAYDILGKVLFAPTEDQQSPEEFNEQN